MRRLALVIILSLSLVCVVAAGGCGGESASSPDGEERQLAEEALRTAFSGDNLGFLALVAPSFLQEASKEMPDVEDEALGGILVAGFLEDKPYVGIKEVKSQVDITGDKAVVHVWGVFLDERGEEVNVGEAEALRIALVREGGRWYLDLLDF